MALNSSSSILQQRQRKLWVALGYSCAIRAYLHCWKELLKRAGMDSAEVIGAIDIALQASKQSERQIRYQLHNLRKFNAR